MPFELPQVVYSPQLLESVISELEAYISWSDQAKIKSQVGAQPDPNEPNRSQETLLVIKNWQSTQGSVDAPLNELLVTLRGLKLPIIHVTLPTSPNQHQRTLLVGWFQQLSITRVLISITADRTIGGGVVVRTPNRMYDWSFRQNLDKNKESLGRVIANA